MKASQREKISKTKPYKKEIFGTKLIHFKSGFLVHHQYKCQTSLATSESCLKSAHSEEDKLINNCKHLI